MNTRDRLDALAEALAEAGIPCFHHQPGRCVIIKEQWTVSHNNGFIVRHSHIGSHSRNGQTLEQVVEAFKQFFARNLKTSRIS